MELLGALLSANLKITKNVLEKFLILFQENFSYILGNRTFFYFFFFSYISENKTFF